MILLLVSPSFIDSQYCWNKEVQVALERHKAGTARVILVILKPVAWQQTPLGQIQTLPGGARPITKWNNSDEAFHNVAEGIQSSWSGLFPAVERGVPLPLVNYCIAIIIGICYNSKYKMAEV